MKLNQALFAPLFPPDNAEPADAAVREFWASIAAPGFDERDPSAVDGIVAGHRRHPTQRNVINLQAGAIGQFDCSKDLGQVRVPTVIVHGTADPLNPISNAEQLSAGIPASTLIPVDGGGHLLPWEQPENLLEILAGS